MNMDGQASLLRDTESLEYLPRTDVARSYGISGFDVLKNVTLAFLVDQHLTIFLLLNVIAHCSGGI